MCADTAPAGEHAIANDANGNKKLVGAGVRVRCLRVRGPGRSESGIRKFCLSQKCAPIS